MELTTTPVAAPAAASVASTEPPTAPPAPAKQDNRPWVEKYRPSALEEVVAHETTLSTLKRLMDSGSLPHLLFYGPPGTGKTTTIQACARYLFGNRIKGNVLEMNASDDRGIDIVRNEIKDFSSTGQVFLGKPGAVKLVVLDEADQMSTDAQAALRRVIEKYTKTVRFCILCNHVNKVIPALQSRCTRFRFGPVKRNQISARIHLILDSEKVPYDEEGVAAAFKLSNGDMRRCINMMQAAALATGAVTEETIYRSTGNPTPQDITAVVEIMVGKEYAEAWEAVSSMVADRGLSVVDLVREIHPFVVRMDLPQDNKCFALTKLADIEYYLSAGSTECVALSAVLGLFQLIRESLTKQVPIAILTK